MSNTSPNMGRQLFVLSQLMCPKPLSNRVLWLCIRGQEKCAPGLSEDRRSTTGCRVPGFLPPDQNEEAEHGQVCQSLQPQQETSFHLQVRLLWWLFALSLRYGAILYHGHWKKSTERELVVLRVSQLLFYLCRHDVLLFFWFSRPTLKCFAYLCDSSVASGQHLL